MGPVHQKKQQVLMASENNGFVQPVIPRFNGHYDHWAMLMENFLRSKEYWSVLENGVIDQKKGGTLTAAQTKVVEEQKLNNLKAKNYLFQAIDRAILETILQKDTAKDIWDSMKKKYQGTARMKRGQLHALHKEFETLHMKGGESVNDYFGRMLTIANKMRIHGEKLDDVAVIEKILRSMTPNFNYVVCSIEESKDIDSLSIDELQSSLLVHEQRIVGNVIEEQALKVSTQGETFQGRGRGRGGFNKENIECYGCHMFGHYQNECPNQEREEKTNFTEDEEEILFMACVDEIEAHQSSDTLYLDSACSNHMTDNKFLFSELDETFRERVKLGNDARISVMGKENSKFQMNGGTVQTTDMGT